MKTSWPTDDEHEPTATADPLLALLRLRSSMDQLAGLVEQTMRTHQGNAQLVDLALDVVNHLKSMDKPKAMA